MNSRLHSPQSLNRVRVWDLPTRIFHGGLVLCLLGLVVSAWVGGNAMVWHFRFGYCVLALLLFRLVWGFWGGRWSRFSAFIYSPRSVMDYLSGRAKPGHGVGHSPIGAMSVFALLGVLAAQVGSGLISDDEIAFAGPLTRFVSNHVVGLATHYHTHIGKWALLGLVLLHFAAIVFYQWRKHALVGAILHGDKALPIATPSSRDDAWSRVLALVLLAACSAVAYWVATLASAPL